MSNQGLTKTVQASGLTLEVIDTSRKNRPPGLRKPYEYILPKAAADLGYKTLHDFLKGWERDRSKFQHAAAWKKGLTKGFKLKVFVLGYTKGLCGDTTGVSREEWMVVTTRVKEILVSWLGKDARAYVDKFTKTDKFGLHFEAYIAYQEMF